MDMVLDGRGRAAMAALAAGRRLSDTPAGLVAVLVGHGLARMERGGLVATAAGRAWTAPARELVERVLPGPAGGARRVTVNLRESPLAWLHARGHVDDRQFAAGERIRADWERAQLRPQVTMRWDAAAVRGGGGGDAPDPTAAQMSARARFDAAVDAAGPGLSDVLWRVACAGEGLEAAERALGWPKRSGKLVLAMALDRVAHHYRIG